MINEEFRLLSDEEKETKFKAVLKIKTKDCLSEDEIRSILLMISPKQQYSVWVYSDVAEFTRILTVKKPQVGRTVFGQVLVGTADLPGRLYSADRAAAIMIRTTGDEVARQLHIYIPSKDFRKDICSNEQQGLEKAHCL